MKFTVQDMCDEQICKEMKDPKNGLLWKGKEPAAEVYANRFLMDVDGHTFTERHRRLMHPKSLVFKMTMFQVRIPQFYQVCAELGPILFLSADESL